MTSTTKNRIISHAALIAVASIVSKVLGVLRDRILASHFGAGTVLDAYFTAFRLPDFIFNLLILGAVSAAFVPVFVHYHSKKQHVEANHIAASVLNALVILLAVLAVIGFIFAEPLTHLIAYGYAPDSEAFRLTVQFTRVMLLSPILLGASAVIGGMLNAYQKFLAYSLAPIFYNLGIIIGVVFFVPTLGTIGLGWGVVLGALLNFIVQLPAVVRAGFRWKAVVDVQHKAVRQIGRLMIPRLFGAAALQFSLFVTVALATTLSEGSVTIYNFANNLQSFPVTIFGVSLSVAAFPVLAQAAAHQRVGEFRAHFSETFRKILFFIVPSSLFLLLLRAQVVRLLLGTGNFDWQDTIGTLDTLAYFVLSLFAQSLIPLVARAFYALQNTRTPVIVSIISMVVNIALSVILAPHMGVTGLALAFTLANFLNLALLLIAMRYSFGSLDDATIVRSTLRILAGSVVASAAMYGMLYVMAALVDTHTVVGLGVQATVAALIGGVVYILVEWLVRSEELHYIREALPSWLRGQQKSAPHNVEDPHELV